MELRLSNQKIVRVSSNKYSATIFGSSLKSRIRATKDLYSVLIDNFEWILDLLFFTFDIKLVFFLRFLSLSGQNLQIFGKITYLVNAKCSIFIVLFSLGIWLVISYIEKETVDFLLFEGRREGGSVGFKKYLKKHHYGFPINACSQS